MTALAGVAGATEISTHTGLRRFASDPDWIELLTAADGPVIPENLVRLENVDVFGGLRNARLGYAASATPASIGRRIGCSGPPI